MRGGEGLVLGDVEEAEPSTQKDWWRERERESTFIGVLQRSWSERRYVHIYHKERLTRSASWRPRALTVSNPSPS